MSANSQAMENSMRMSGERLRAARRGRGLSQTDLGRLADTSVSHISQLEHEKSGTSIRTALATAQALNVSVEYLVGWVDDPRPAGELLVQLSKLAARRLDGEAEDREGLEADAEDFVGVNEIRASAGAGAEVMSERITDRVKFRRPWMRKHGLHGEQCRIVKVTGESMEPTLPEGSSILVDTGRREPRDGRIFVIRVEDRIVVKRLVRHPVGGWLIQSDNPNKQAWPTQPCPPDADIVGEVKWVARTFA